MAEEIIVTHGCTHLSGTVRVSGAKNSALKLIAAALLGQGKSVLHNVPNISDIDIMIEVLESLGASVERTGHTIAIDTANATGFETPYELVSKMRASISILGPLIGRFGKARVAMPGGCKIGARKIDMHLSVLEALGVNFVNDHGYLYASSPNGLHAAKVFLDFPSVGATENMLMASVTTEGTTVIDNAAREPEIVDLANMLNEMGACVQGAGTSTIVVHGVALSDMHPCEHWVVGDRIEAGTYLTAGALLGGPITVEGIDPEFLRTVLMKFEEMGANILTTEDSITVSRMEPLRPTDIQTLPHPGFPTDMQAQFSVLAAFADGCSVVSENIFENRFMHVPELCRMGAHITIEGHTAIVEGVAQLTGTTIMATDLRASASLVIAALAAQGSSTVDRIYHLDRGYERMEEKLRALGADIVRIDV